MAGMRLQNLGLIATLLAFAMCPCARQLVTKGPFARAEDAFKTIVNAMTLYDAGYSINVYYATPPSDPVRVYIVSNCRHSAFNLSQVRHCSPCCDTPTLRLMHPPGYHSLPRCARTVASSGPTTLARSTTQGSGQTDASASTPSAKPATS